MSAYHEYMTGEKEVQVDELSEAITQILTDQRRYPTGTVGRDPITGIIGPLTRTKGELYQELFSDRSQYYVQYGPRAETATSGIDTPTVDEILNKNILLLRDARILVAFASFIENQLSNAARKVGWKPERLTRR